MSGHLKPRHSDPPRLRRKCPYRVSADLSHKGGLCDTVPPTHRSARRQLSLTPGHGHGSVIPMPPSQPTVAAGLQIGYARCSTDEQDLTAQRETLVALGVEPNRIYIDQGLTGTNRDRPGLREALAAVRAGDTLVVPKLDRLARSVPDAREIGDSLANRGVKLSLGRTIYDPNDPLGKMFFNILATFAEFEVDLLRMRTREGMAIARARGRLRGKQPKLTARQERHLRELHERGEHTVSELAELFSISRASVYRTLARSATSD